MVSYVLLYTRISLALLFHQLAVFSPLHVFLPHLLLTVIESVTFIGVVPPCSLFPRFSLIQSFKDM